VGSRFTCVCDIDTSKYSDIAERCYFFGESPFTIKFVSLALYYTTTKGMNLKSLGKVFSKNTP